MSDLYKYLDLDYIYTDPKTGILRNLANITDSDDLLFFESGAVAKRIQELYEVPIKIKGVDFLEDKAIKIYGYANLNVFIVIT